MNQYNKKQNTKPSNVSCRLIEETLELNSVGMNQFNKKV